MTEAELEPVTIAEISPRLKNGEISRVQLTNLFLDRIARLNLGRCSQGRRRHA